MRPLDPMVGRHLRNSPTSHGVGGLILIVFGVLLMLSNMGYFEFREVFRFWPVFFMALGVVRLVEARDRQAMVGPLIWIGVASVFLLRSLRIINVDFRDLWPIFLIAMGLLMLRRSMATKRERSTNVDSNSVISGLAILGGMERRNNSQDFKGGEVTAILGGCEVDLRGASMPPGEVVLDVFAMWGGIEIRIPTDWSVVGKVTPILGGFDDESESPKEDSKRLVVRGFAIMGGVGVKN